MLSRARRGCFDLRATGPLRVASIVVLLFVDAWFTLAAATVRALFGRSVYARSPWRRRAATLVIAPALAVALLVHQLALVLDELLFPSYRRVRIDAPVFVVGVPRSGTTLLHRALAADEAATTFTLWECVAAPSIVQRRAIGLLGRVDRALGGFGARLVRGAEARLAKGLDGIHVTRLGDPEEDYLALLPAMGCFLVTLAFPEEDRLWALGRFDRSVPAGRRKRMLAFYRGLVQRHLYHHGPGRRFLSKNASFSSWCEGLAEAFPDARFLCPTRDPMEVVPSQLSSIQGSLRALGVEPAGPFQARLVAQLEHYYDHVLIALPRAARGRVAFLPLERLRSDLERTVVEAFEHVGLEPSASLREALSEAGAGVRGYRSAHRYSYASVELDEESLRARFDPIRARLAPSRIPC